MNKKSLWEYIEQGRGFRIEFVPPAPPQKLAKSVAAEIVAFANAEGGTLLIGVSGEGQVLGVSDPKEVMGIVESVAKQCWPPVQVEQEIVQTTDGNVVMVQVPKGQDKPYRTPSRQSPVRTRARALHGRREVPFSELLRLHVAPDCVLYIDAPVFHASIDDLNLDQVAGFRANFFEADPNISDLDWLAKHGLVFQKQRVVYPTVSGLLLFGQSPQSYLPHTAIHIEGAPHAITGTLFEMPEKVLSDLKSYLELPQNKSDRYHYPVLPEAALREIIVNALVHRDYDIASPVRILVRKQHMEVRSPGTLPKGIKPEMVKAGVAHWPRNQLLYMFLVRANLMPPGAGKGFWEASQLIRQVTGEEMDICNKGNETVVYIPRTMRS